MIVYNETDHRPGAVRPVGEHQVLGDDQRWLIPISRSAATEPNLLLSMDRRDQCSYLLSDYEGFSAAFCQTSVCKKLQFGVNGSTMGFHCDKFGSRPGTSTAEVLRI